VKSYVGETHGSENSSSKQNARNLAACCAFVDITENIAMDKNRIVGSAKEIKGEVKEGVGKAIGDAKLQADGRADQAEGKVQNAIGGVTDAVREALKK
jgi:uncharacterized protein YjbJ (UPF0337 family)